MRSLDRRLRALEERTPAVPPSESTGTFAEEVRAIDAEIRKLEREMIAEGIDPYPKPDKTRTDSAGHPKLSLDEHIAMLEAQIAHDEEAER